MILTTREKVLLIILMVLCFFGGLYYFYLEPTLDRITRLEIAINTQQAEFDSAEMRTLRNMVYNARIGEGLEDNWELAVENVPEYFNRTEMMRLIQDIVYPHANDEGSIQISFLEDHRMQGNLFVHGVAISFVGYRPGLNAVLNTFANAAPENRIVNYAIVATDPVEAGLSGELNIGLGIEFITLGLTPPPPPAQY